VSCRSAGHQRARMLHAVGDGETDPAALAALAESAIAGNLRAVTRRLRACADLHPVSSAINHSAACPVNSMMSHR
jgi:hypothetical protein